MMSKHRKPYRVLLSDEGGKFSFDDDFWTDEPCDAQGETPFDTYVEAFLTELKLNLYWLGTQRTARH